jgi:hypothetical protein
MTMIQAKMTMRWVVGVGMGGGEEDRRRSWCFLLPSQFENVLSVSVFLFLFFLALMDGWNKHHSEQRSAVTANCEYDAYETTSNQASRKHILITSYSRISSQPTVIILKNSPRYQHGRASFSTSLKLRERRPAI